MKLYVFSGYMQIKKKRLKIILKIPDEVNLSVFYVYLRHIFAFFVCKNDILKGN